MPVVTKASSKNFIGLIWYIWNIKIIMIALAGVAQWTEHLPVNESVANLIPSQGTHLGFGPGPQ